MIEEISAYDVDEGGEERFRDRWIESSDGSSEEPRRVEEIPVTPDPAFVFHTSGIDVAAPNAACIRRIFVGSRLETVEFLSAEGTLISRLDWSGRGMRHVTGEGHVLGEVRDRRDERGRLVESSTVVLGHELARKELSYDANGFLESEIRTVEGRQVDETRYRYTIVRDGEWLEREVFRRAGGALRRVEVHRRTIQP